MWIYSNLLLYIFIHTHTYADRYFIKLLQNYTGTDEPMFVFFLSPSVQAASRRSKTRGTEQQRGFRVQNSLDRL